MGRYVARRLLQLVLVLLGATSSCSAACSCLPGDPVGSLGGDRVRDPAVVEELRERYGLDDPLVVQYGNYLWRTVQGDLGEDYTQRRPVSKVLAPKFVNSAKLAIVAIVFDIVLGVSAGILAALLVYATFSVGVAVVAEASLSFLGVGVKPDVPEWGNMISVGRSFVGSNDYLWLFPSARRGSHGLGVRVRG